MVVSKDIYLMIKVVYYYSKNLDEFFDLVIGLIILFWYIGFFDVKVFI